MILVSPYQSRIFYDYDSNLQQKQFVLCALAHLQHQNVISLPAACDNHCAGNQSTNIPNWILCTVISAVAASCVTSSPSPRRPAHLRASNP